MTITTFAFTTVVIAEVRAAYKLDAYGRRLQAGASAHPDDAASRRLVETGQHRELLRPYATAPQWQGAQHLLAVAP